MLRYQSTQSGRQEAYIDREMPASEAFACFILSEIRWGTTMIALSPTAIVCETMALSRTDINEYTGNEAEMLPLVRAAVIYLQFRQACGDSIEKVVFNQIPMTTEGGYSAFDIETFGGFLVGSAVARSVALLAVDIKPADWSYQLSIDETVTALEYQLETGKSAFELV